MAIKANNDIERYRENIGVGITLTTGAPLLKVGGRQVLFGLAAAAITFVLGRLVGGHLG
ncbi:MAG TPA: hypothetical protein VKY19_13100 [Ktedonosporobacter sp.]|jgi:VIT1/CCC1 family predicted Fe2+/Mn2+ transporter|nr:hypothetical protein [Ktedonosporobacter sp.]